MNEQMITVSTSSLVPSERMIDKKESDSIKFMDASYKMLTPEKKQKFDVAYVFILTAVLLVLAVSLFVWQTDERKKNYEDEIREQAVETYKAEVQAKIEEESAARSLAMKSEAARIGYEIDMLTKLFEGVRDYKFSENSLITFGLSVYNRVDSEDPLYPDTMHEVLTQNGQYEMYSDNNSMVRDYRRIAEKLVKMRYNSESKPITSDYVWAVFIDGEVWLTKKFGSSNITDYWQYTG